MTSSYLNDRPHPHLIEYRWPHQYVILVTIIRPPGVQVHDESAAHIQNSLEEVGKISQGKFDIWNSPKLEQGSEGKHNIPWYFCWCLYLGCNVLLPIFYRSDFWVQVKYIDGVSSNEDSGNEEEEDQDQGAFSSTANNEQCLVIQKHLFWGLAS